MFGFFLECWFKTWILAPEYGDKHFFRIWRALMDKTAVKINFRLADDAVVAHSLNEKLDHKPNIYLSVIPSVSMAPVVQMNNRSQVCLHSCCLTWQSWPSPSTSGYPNPQAWGKVARRLPDIKTNSHERWTPRQKRWRGGGNQSVERPKYHQKGKKACKNNPISALPDLSRPSHIWRWSKGCDWFIIWMSRTFLPGTWEQGFPPSKLA